MGSLRWTGGLAALVVLLCPAPAHGRLALVAQPSSADEHSVVSFRVRGAARVSRVAFAIDGRRVAVDRRRPFGASASARDLGPGAHRLTARVWRSGHAFTLSRVVQVTRDGDHAAVTAEPSADGSPGTAPPWAPTLAWADEFSGPANASPDPARWIMETGRSPYGGEDQYYTARPENVSTDGQGHLRIVAKLEAYKGALYTSGRLHTQGRFEPQYGRIEARIRTPAGRGLLPAFWMLGREFDDARNWPQVGEIDVMEITGNDPFTYYGHIHGPRADDASRDVAEQRTVRADIPFTDDFHVYAIDWHEGSIQFLVDGLPVGPPVTPSTYASRGGTWVYDHPFFLLLNLAVGNAWTGEPDMSTKWPATMLVDWVRVYR